MEQPQRQRQRQRLHLQLQQQTQQQLKQRNQHSTTTVALAIFDLCRFPVNDVAFHPGEPFHLSVQSESVTSSWFWARRLSAWFGNSKRLHMSACLLLRSCRMQVC